MEEQNENNNTEIKPDENNEKTQIKSGETESSRKRFIVGCLALFFGSFLAVYFVTDQYSERKIRMSEISQMRQMSFDDAFFMRMSDFDGMRNFKQIEREFFKNSNIRPGTRLDVMKMPELINSPVKIKTEHDDDKYEIKVCLNPFENNPDNIKYELNDNVLRVYGKSESVKKNVNTSVSFSQDFVLPDNSDKDGIITYREKNNLVISIPYKK